MTKPIDSFKNQYRFLSNFWFARVEFDGEFYRTVEHAYQAAKTLNKESRRLIRHCERPGETKRMGRKVRMREDWEEIKVFIMKGLVKQKFTNHPDLKESLLQTGDVELVEGNHWGDTFWGVCDGKGQNWLGRILMEVRDEIQD